MEVIIYRESVEVLENSRKQVAGLPHNPFIDRELQAHANDAHYLVLARVLLPLASAVVQLKIILALEDLDEGFEVCLQQAKKLVELGEVVDVLETRRVLAVAATCYELSCLNCILEIECFTYRHQHELKTVLAVAEEFLLVNAVQIYWPHAWVNLTLSLFVVGGRVVVAAGSGVHVRQLGQAALGHDAPLVSDLLFVLIFHRVLNLETAFRIASFA